MDNVTLPPMPGLKSMLERYEELRAMSLRWANLSDFSKETCHEALAGIDRGPDAYRYAMVLDDMALLVKGIEAYAREAVLAERTIWKTLQDNECTIAPNYVRDKSGKFNGWLVIGRHMQFEKADTPYEAAQKFAAAIRNQPIEG